MVTDIVRGREREGGREHRSTTTSTEARRHCTPELVVVGRAHMQFCVQIVTLPLCVIIRAKAATDLY